MRLKHILRLIYIIVLLWGVVVVAGLLLSRSFKDKVISILTSQANEYLLTQIQVRENDIHLSFFKKFPKASLELNNVTVKIPPELQKNQVRLIHGDTLLFAGKIFLQLDLLELLHNKYQLESIIIEDGVLQILSDKQGNSSLTILKKRSETGDRESFAANIEKLSAQNVKLYTHNASNNTVAELLIYKGASTGNLSADNFSFNLKFDGSLNRLKVDKMELTPYQKLSADLLLNKVDKEFRIEKGELNYSNIPLKIIGSIRNDENTLVDFIVQSNNASLKRIDETFMQRLLKDRGLNLTGGNLDLYAKIKGYTSGTLPSITAKYTLRNGTIEYKSEKIKAEDIYIQGSFGNGRYHRPVSSNISIDTFSYTIGENRQSGALNVQNLDQPRFKIKTRGIIYSELLNKFSGGNYNFKNGHISNDLWVSGKLTLGNKSLFTGIELQGSAQVYDLLVSNHNNKLPALTANGLIEIKSKDHIGFSDFKAQGLTSNILLNGQLTNISRKDRFPTYTGSIYSENFVVDEFLLNNDSEKTVTVNFPDSVLIRGQLKVDRFKYYNFEATNISSNISYAPLLLKLYQLNMQGFEGSATATFHIEQLANKNLYLKTDADIRSVNIHKLFVGCNNFAQDVILAPNISGKLSGNLHFSTEWTSSFKMIPESIISTSNIVLQNGKLIDYQPLMGLSRFIPEDDLKEISFGELKTGIDIRNSMVKLQQTSINTSAFNFDGSGMHDFDNKYSYHLQVELSELLWHKARKKDRSIADYGYVVEDDDAHTIVPVLIEGKGTTYHIKYDRRTARNRVRENLRQEREELRELFRPEKGTANEPEMDTPSENDEEPETPALERTDSNKLRNTEGDFILEWDDE